MDHGPVPVQSVLRDVAVQRQGPTAEGVRIYVGADAGTVQGRPFQLTGFREFSAAYGPNSRFWPEHLPDIRGLLDSGAFSDPPEKRLDPEAALARQLRWEDRASNLWGGEWRSEALVSYDLLIDETWTHGHREKRRWSVADAERAVRVTVDAAAYLAARREDLRPRTLVLACQGVDPQQYAECADGVLAHACPDDWFGLGGWCILGRQRRWLPAFWQSLRLCLPKVAKIGLTHVHIFGVTWPVALGGLLWLADRHALTVSTDGSKPVLSVVWKDHKKAGVLAPTWEENVRLTQHQLYALRGSEWYREPPNVRPMRQEMLF